MEAAAFEEENCVLNPPPGVSSEDCAVLPVWRGVLQDTETPVVISCWRVTKEELAEIQRTGRVWVMVWGDTMPPIAPCGISPFKKEPE